MRLGVTLVLGLSLFAVYSTNTLLSTMLPIITTQFNLTPFLAGLITAIYGWAYAVMQMPVGVLSDRYEPRRIIILSMFFFFLSSIFFASSFDSSLLFFSRLAMGAAASFIFVVGLKMIVLNYQPQERGRGTGLFTSIGLLGIPVINFVAPIAVQSFRIDWRTIYLAMSSISLLAVVLTTRFLPKRLGIQPTSLGSAAQANLRDSIIKVSSNRDFWMQNLIAFTYFGTFIGLVFWLPSYFEKSGFGLIYGGVAVSLLGAGSVVGSALVGLFTDKVSRKLVLRVFMIFYSILLAYLILALVGGNAILLILVTSFFIGLGEGGSTANIRIIGELFDKGLVGTAYGIYNTMTWAGLAFFPMLIGSLLSVGLDFERAFIPMPFFMLLALVASAFPRESKV